MTDDLKDLLGLDTSIEKPNAYQLFGLQPGEEDPEQILAAIAQTVNRLKQRQANTPAPAWKRAASAVSQAKKLLTDPQVKAAYDAKLAARSGGQNAAKAVRSRQTIDPLDGLLPSGDPLAPFDMEAAVARAGKARRFSPPPLPQPSSVASPPPAEPPPHPAESPPQSLPIQPPVAEPTASPADIQIPLPVDPGFTPRQRRSRRRKKFPLAYAFLGVMVLAMLAGLGYALHLLTQRENRRLAQGDGPAAAAPRRPAEPRRRQPADDPVMGSVPGASGSAAMTRDLPPLPQPTTGMGIDTGSGMAPGDGAMTEPTAVGGMAEDEDNAPPSKEMDMADESADQEKPPAPAKPDPQQLAAGKAAIEAAEAAIRQADWAGMKPIAQKAVDAAADPAQTESATELFQIADLAEYYAQGLYRALDGLKSGNALEISPGVRVAIIEASPDRLMLQVRGRPRSYPFAEIPLIVVQKLETFSMDASAPITQASGAIFQYLAPISKAEDRAEALETLRGMPAVEDKDPAKLADVLERLQPTGS